MLRWEALPKLVRLKLLVGSKTTLSGVQQTDLALCLSYCIIHIRANYIVADIAVKKAKNKQSLILHTFCCIQLIDHN